MSHGVRIKRLEIDAESKLAAVLEGLKGSSTFTVFAGSIGSVSFYYRWLDKFLETGSQALASWNGPGFGL